MGCVMHRVMDDMGKVAILTSVVFSQISISTKFFFAEYLYLSDMCFHGIIVNSVVVKTGVLVLFILILLSYLNYFSFKIV